MAVNTVIIVGRLVKDPELKDTKSGMKVCSFSVASEKRKTAKNPDPGTNFIDCVAWANTAENMAKYLKKGSEVVVNGRLDQQSWEQDGMKRSKLIVIADEVQFVGGKAREQLPTDQEVDDLSGKIPF